MPKPLRKSEGPENAQEEAGILQRMKNFVVDLFKKHAKVLFTVGSTVLLYFAFKRMCLDKFVASSDIMAQINQKAFEKVINMDLIPVGNFGKLLHDRSICRSSKGLCDCDQRFGNRFRTASST